MTVQSITRRSQSKAKQPSHKGNGTLAKSRKETLKQIKARFIANRSEMLRKARENCKELTGKDRL